MKTLEVGYKARAYEGHNLAIFFLISTVYPPLLPLLSSHGSRPVRRPADRPAQHEETTMSS